MKYIPSGTKVIWTDAPPKWMIPSVSIGELSYNHKIISIRV